MNLELIKKRKSPVTLDENKALEFWKEGKPDKEISEICNVSLVSVRNWRHRNKLPINKADGKRVNRYPRRKERYLTPLEKDAKAAMEAGLTYGQYKSKQREELW